MHKIKNNPISNDDAVNKKYVDDNTTTKQDKTDNSLDTTDKTVVGSINELNKNFMKSITFKDTTLNITYKNGKVTTVPLNDFISGIIAKANLFSMIVVDALPTVADNGDGTYTITYVQSGKSKTTKNENVWFLYNVKGTYKETMFVGTTEITRDAGSIDLSNYVNKLTDVISTWDFKDLTKIPTMASLKNGITDTINSTSTSTDIASAKGVYDFKNYTIINYPDLRANNTITVFSDLVKLVPLNKTWYIVNFKEESLDTADAIEKFGFPTNMNAWGNIQITCKQRFDVYRSYYIELQTDGNSQFTYRWLGECTSVESQGVEAYAIKWRMLCSTSVADKIYTSIPVSNITNATITTGGDLSYSIKNGICYVRINGLVLSGKGRVTVPTGTFPIPNNSLTNGHFPVVTNNSNCYLAVLSSSGGLSINCGTGTDTVYTSFSYPVAES